MDELLIHRDGSHLFKKHQEDFLKIYYNAFTQPPYTNQYLDIAQEKNWLLQFFQQWQAECYYAFLKGKLVAFMMIAPSSYDDKLPISIWDKFNKNDCLSIAELAVSSSCRRLGIAQQFLNKLFDDAFTKHILVRTNENATAAQNLYEKNHFKKIVNFKAKTRIIDNDVVKGVLIPKVLYIREINQPHAKTF